MNPIEPPWSGTGPPVTEADLHAYVDRQLAPARRAEVERHLAVQPDAMARVRDWQRHNGLLRQLFAPVQDEPLPRRLRLSVGSGGRAWRGLAASVAIAVVSAGAAWFARGTLEAQAARLAGAPPLGLDHAHDDASAAALAGFARRAAVAHVVYSPDVRRPVEVGAGQEQQLVAWLSKRLGTEVRPPSLLTLGYELIGGRLLPGDSGPVAQFMYHDGAGQRLTLYVTREVPQLAGQPGAAFRFGQDGPVNVFYWVDRKFGYAISGGADRQSLLRVAQEVYRQLGAG